MADSLELRLYVKQASGFHVHEPVVTSDIPSSLWHFYGVHINATTRREGVESRWNTRVQVASVYRIWVSLCLRLK